MMRRTLQALRAGSLRKTVLRLLSAGLIAMFAVAGAADKARACFGCSCEFQTHGTVIPPPPGYTTRIPCAARNTIRCVIRDEHQLTTDHILEEFEDLEEFIVDPSDPLNQERIWGGYLLPAMMMMSEQIVHTAMFQMMILGNFFDAKTQLETQTLFQRLLAEAHKDYQPSVEMCTIGTNVRSLAEAEQIAEYTTFIMSQRSIDRQMGNMHTAAARGQFDDTCFRLRQFRRRYCDPADNNNHMLWLCDPEAARTAAGGAAPAAGGTTVDVFYRQCLPATREVTDETKDKDISFMRTVDRANTLYLEFYTGYPAASPDPTDDEEDVFALASNLYSNRVMYRMPEAAMRSRSAEDELLDMRTIVAKRAVAEHSFNVIVGMKAMSKDKTITDTYPYMRILLENLGYNDTDVPGSNPARDALELYLGERPSYFAQMGILTKKLYENPDFFTTLYDEPANVERKGVALQAIGLMQDFDTWNSYLRTEAMLSVILELELLRLNGQVEDRMSAMRSGGIKL